MVYLFVILFFWCVFCYSCYFLFFFFFKQKTAYEMRISDWSSDVCSSDLIAVDGSLYATFFHSGQVCESGTRLLLSREHHDDFVQALVERKIGRASCRERVCQYV